MTSAAAPTALDPSPRATLNGILLMLLAVAVFGVMDVLIKLLTERYGVFQIIFFRSVFALLPLSLAIARNGGLGALRTRRPLAHLLRSAAGVMALMSFVYSFKHLPLAEVYAIMFAAPLFLTALSVPLLGEPVGWRRWTAVAVGFLGVLVMMRPGSGLASSVSLVTLGGALFYALAMISLRRLGRTETTAAIVFYFTLTCGTVGGVLMLPDWVTPASPADWAMLAGIGVVGGTAQLLITQAFRLAPAAVVAPFDYTALVWGVLFGWLFFGHLPDLPMIAGGLIVVGSGLYILHREARTRLPAPVTGRHP